MADNEFLTGYLSGQNENRNNGMFGGGWEGLLGLIVIASLFGYGGVGFGFGGGGAGLQGMATRADITSGFQFNDLQNGVRGLERGLCDGFYNVQNSFNTLGHQISDCCCTTQRAIDNVNFNMAKGFCDLGNVMNNNTRDIIDAQNSGTRAILDFLTQDKIATLTAENQSLKFAASQSRQNDYLSAVADAKTAELIRRLGADCPTPAYVVQPPTPVNFPTNGCGTFTGWGGNWGGGCGNGYAFAG